MHHVLIILTLPFIQDHTDLINENNIFDAFINCPRMLITLAMEIIRRKVYIIVSQSDDIDLHDLRSQLRLKLEKFVTCSIDCNSVDNILSYRIDNWHEGRLTDR